VQEELSDLAMAGGNHEAPEQIKRLALDFALMSAYTAFVAHESRRKALRDKPELPRQSPGSLWSLMSL